MSKKMVNAVLFDLTIQPTTILGIRRMFHSTAIKLTRPLFSQQSLSSKAKNLLFAITVCIGCLCNSVGAHDTWVQTNSLLARPDDVVHVDLMLGNHGNNHRDFKLASKITIDKCTLIVKTPSGTLIDLKPRVVDCGSAAKEGFWSAKFDSQESGIYEVLHTLDTLHGTTRAIKTAKTYVLARDSHAELIKNVDLAAVPINKNLEIVLDTPIDQLAASTPIRCTLLKHGKPHPGVRVSFIPRGAKLADDMDANYERMSDANGHFEYTPIEGNLILIVAHDVAEDESGEGFDKTHYGATLVLSVPKRPFRDISTTSSK